MARRLTNLQLPKVSAPTLPKLGKKKAAAAEITVQATKLSLSLAADAASSVGTTARETLASLQSGRGALHEAQDGVEGGGGCGAQHAGVELHRHPPVLAAPLQATAARIARCVGPVRPQRRAVEDILQLPLPRPIGRRLLLRARVGGLRKEGRAAG